jgi:hypothetical protein
MKNCEYALPLPLFPPLLTHTPPSLHPLSFVPSSLSSPLFSPLHSSSLSCLLSISPSYKPGLGMLLKVLASMLLVEERVISRPLEEISKNMVILYKIKQNKNKIKRE